MCGEREDKKRERGERERETKNRRQFEGFRFEVVDAA
jgi:hypothetical protein